MPLRVHRLNWKGGLHHRVVATSSFYARPGHQIRPRFHLPRKLPEPRLPFRCEPTLLPPLTYSKNSSCRKKKKGQTRDRTWDRLPLFMKGALTTELPSRFSWSNHQLQHWSAMCCHDLAHIARIESQIPTC